MNFRKCLRSVGVGVGVGRISVITVDALFIVDGGFRDNASADSDVVVVVVALNRRH